MSNQDKLNYRWSENAKQDGEQFLPAQHNRQVLWPYVLTSALSIFLTIAVCFFAFSSFYKTVPGRLAAEAPSSSEQASKSKAAQEIKAPVACQGNSPAELCLTFPYDDESKLALEKLKEVYLILKDEYYKELSDKEILEAMLAGMLSKLDSPYTFYMNAEESKSVEESMAGKYSGIGALVMAKEGQYIISDIFDKSPAQNSGLLIGDIFLSVDGKQASDYNDVTSLAAIVRGPEGTEVEIVVYRPLDKKEHTFQVTRGKITNSNLQAKMLEDGIGYIRINEFNGGVSKNFIDAVEKLMEAGAKSFVFDLRNNGGGYVLEVTRMLDYLLPKGVLAKASGRSEGKEFTETWDSAAGMGVPEDMHYSIIVNNFSASASELFAGCLRDWKKAQLVGEQTFGKGVGTVTYDLPDGSSVQITNFHYYLPGGACVDGEGLTPDYPVELAEQWKGFSLSQIPTNEDEQLKKAIEILKEKDSNE